jgi:hypothetical protein
VKNPQEMSKETVLQYGSGHDTVPAPEQKRIIVQVSKLAGERETIMGDRSPKAVQKQTKTASANQKKQQAVAAKQSANTKR